MCENPTTTRRPSCCQQSRPSTNFVDKMIDLPWRNFLSPEFATKFQRKVGLPYLELPEFPYSTVCRIGGRKPPCQKKQFDPFSRFSGQEAQLSPRDRAMRRVSWNRAKRRTHVSRIAVHKSCNRRMTFKVVQGHWKWHESMGHMNFLLMVRIVTTCLSSTVSLILPLLHIYSERDCL